MAAIQRQVREGQARVDVAAWWGISRWTVDSIMSGRFTGRDASEARQESERIRQIRTLAAAGTTQQEIAERFGLTQQAVSQIVRGVTHPETGGPISTG
ncbi:MAG TPA: helix-turn-helix transcriptional regulator [Actinomycetales bacterium]|nr:helix-turn-helix transcriptional regulator [Actinomycetales bacterium]